MLEIFLGTNQDALRRQAREVLRAAAGEDTVSVIASEDFTTGQLVDAVGAASLFGGREVYLLDTPSNDADFLAEVEAQVEAMSTSENVFAVVDIASTPTLKKKYKQHGTLHEAALPKDEFNVFTLTDALATKDKKQLWILFMKARLSGKSAEELIGVLWWQLKSLRLAALTNTPEEAGMKPYPYNKAKRSLSTWKEGELEAVSATLLTLYHEGHNGEVDIDDALEAWVLGL